MKVLLDQGIPYSTGKHLRAAGWEVQHTVDLKMERATDQAIIRFARENDFCCVSLDADFHSMIAVANETKPSVVRIRQEGLDGEAMATLLLAIWPVVESALNGGALVTVTDKAVRLRHLPIQR